MDSLLLTNTVRTYPLNSGKKRSSSRSQFFATNSSIETLPLETPAMNISKSQIVNEERRRLYHEADVVVVGAGIFGCAAAVAFARQGRSVILLERSMKEPDRIVGELLQPGGISALEKLGLSHCLEGIDSVQVDGYEIFYYGNPVNIPYPANAGAAKEGGFQESANEKSSRPKGRSFHHGRFISQLRKACAAEPNITIFETEVLNTISNTHQPQVLGVETRTLDTETGERNKDCFFGQLTLIADGSSSKFRKQYINKAPMVKSRFYALELIDCPMPAPNHGIVVLSDASPILLYQIGTHETRCLMDVTPEANTAAGGIPNYIRNIVLPTLPKQVQPCFENALQAALQDDKIIRSMPNSWLPPSTQTEKGLVILGDAMNMRHPLTGGGMTVAFNDVVLLSNLLSPSRIPDLGETVAVQKAMKEFHWKRKGLSSIINILAQALYSLFAANDIQLKALQKGCFAYFQKGGNCVDGPAGLLAGIIRQPFLLFYHFFAVALLSIWIVMQETMGSLLGLWKFPLAVEKSVLVFWKACVVIFPFIFSEIRS